MIQCSGENVKRNAVICTDSNMKLKSVADFLSHAAQCTLTCFVLFSVDCAFMSLCLYVCLFCAHLFLSCPSTAAEHRPPTRAHTLTHTALCYTRVSTDFLSSLAVASTKKTLACDQTGANHVPVFLYFNKGCHSPSISSQ